MTSELIERVARAIADTTDFDGDRIASRYADSELRDIAQSAITAVIEADREAVRAEQAAELAKFKALAETLATDLRECARALQSLRQTPGTGADGRLWQRIKEITDAAHAAVAQYKEARDAS